tara:strand:- start:3399 stop:4223 length:825 start_codon:yes stop_codon:yes gene_type:complete
MSARGVDDGDCAITEADLILGMMEEFADKKSNVALDIFPDANFSNTACFANCEQMVPRVTKKEDMLLSDNMIPRRENSADEGIMDEVDILSTEDILCEGRHGTDNKGVGLMSTVQGEQSSSGTQEDFANMVDVNLLIDTELDIFENNYARGAATDMGNVNSTPREEEEEEKFISESKTEVREVKKRKRMLANRESAKLSRLRKKQLMETLEKQVEDERQKVKKLEKEIEDEREKAKEMKRAHEKEVSSLMAQLENMRVQVEAVRNEQQEGGGGV